MDTDAIMREMQAAFRVEAEELVTDLEESLLKLESDNTNSDLIDRVFRSLHTLKGSGSSGGFLKLAAFLHIFEDAFNLAREGKMIVSQELIELSLQTVDRITQFVGEAPSSGFDKAAIEADPILIGLKKIMPQNGSGPIQAEDGGNVRKADSKLNLYTISFKPFENFGEFGNEPISVLDELREHGNSSIEGYGTVPPLGQFDTEKTYLAWEIKLYSKTSYEDIEEVFSFVEMDADIKIESTPRDRDETSNDESLFDTDLLSDFYKEALPILGGLRKMAHENSTSCNWIKIGNAVHALNGVCGILISTANTLVPKLHPLVILSHLCEATEDLAKSQQDSFHKTYPELVGNISKNLDELFYAFCLKYRSLDLEEELLRNLNLDPELFCSSCQNQSATDIPPEQEAFTNVLEQSIAMLENCSSVLTDDNFLSELKIIERGFNNIERAALSNDDTSLLDVCSKFKKQNKGRTDGGASTFNKFITPLIDELKEVTKNEATPKSPANTEFEKPQETTQQKTKSSLRVDEEKIDRLMRAVGELLVARGAFPLIAKNVADNHGLSAIAQELREAGSNVARLADELQGAVMSIRMRPLQGLFQRFPRLVRDVSKKLGKDINLVLEGEDTELDKSMVEQLGDPLVHIIRNALDHGVETAEERAATEKNQTSTIKLGAYTEGSTVAIKISDDGRGLDPQILKLKALEKGLITQAEADTMPDTIAQEIIMRPGFSTAAAVTDLSGRGVGMDVVANNIRKLHGTIEIDSVLGKGTTFTLRLPTSLLVSEAILIKSGEEEYLIPTDSVASLEKMPLTEMRTHAGTRMMTIRDEVVNLVDLRELLATERENETLPSTLNIALIHTSQGRLGLIVDKFQSQEDIVVKPLSGELSSVKLFSGVSIMGDGRVVPVVNALEIHSFYLKTARNDAERLLKPQAQ